MRIRRNSGRGGLLGRRTLALTVLVVIGAAGLTAAPVAAKPDVPVGTLTWVSKGSDEVTDAAFAPAGRQVALSVGAVDGSVVIRDLRTGKTRQVIRGGGWRPTFSPDGRRLALAGLRSPSSPVGQASLSVVDATSGKVLLAPPSILNAGDSAGESRSRWFWAPDSRTLYFSGTRCTAPNGCIDPSGNNALDYSAEDGTFALDIASGGITLLPSVEQVPTLSPDGRRMASFLYDDSTGDWRLLLVQTDIGTGAVTRTDLQTMDIGFTVRDAQFTPDGTAILVQADTPPQLSGLAKWSRQVLRLDPRTGTFSLAVTRNGAAIASDVFLGGLSPDGRLVAIGTAEKLVPTDTNGAFDLYVQDLRSGAFTPVSTTSQGAFITPLNDGGPFFRGFSPDGRDVLFMGMLPRLGGAGDNGSMDAYVKRVR